MSIVFGALLIAAALVTLGNLLALPFSRRKRTKFLTALGGLVVVVASAVFGVLVAERDAKEAGFLGLSDQGVAREAGYSDAAQWSEIRGAYPEMKKQARIRDAALKDARNGLELFFFKRKLWQAVRCDDGAYDGQQFVYCHPSDDTSFGGLFLVDVQEAKPVAYPINGKAMQYVDGHEATLTNGEPLPFRKWDGEMINIASVRESLID